MQTLLRILERAGGYRPTLYLKIENPPYMALVIEAVPEPGPLGVPAISVAHYGEQNGDLMRDPEMCFEWSKPPPCPAELSPYYFRNDYMGVEQFSRFRQGNDYVCGRLQPARRRSHYPCHDGEYVSHVRRSRPLAHGSLHSHPQLRHPGWRCTATVVRMARLCLFARLPRLRSYHVCALCRCDGLL